MMFNWREYQSKRNSWLTAYLDTTPPMAAWCQKLAPGLQPFQVKITKKETTERWVSWTLWKSICQTLTIFSPQYRKYQQQEKGTKPAWCNFLVVLPVTCNLLGRFSSAFLQFQLLSPKKMHARDGCLVHSNIISCRVRDLQMWNPCPVFSMLVVIADKVSSLMH